MHLSNPDEYRTSSATNTFFKWEQHLNLPLVLSRQASLVNSFLSWNDKNNQDLEMHCHNKKMMDTYSCRNIILEDLHTVWGPCENVCESVYKIVTMIVRENCKNTCETTQDQIQYKGQLWLLMANHRHSSQSRKKKSGRKRGERQKEWEKGKHTTAEKRLEIAEGGLTTGRWSPQTQGRSGLLGAEETARPPPAWAAETECPMTHRESGGRPAQSGTDMCTHTHKIRQKMCQYFLKAIT